MRSDALIRELYGKVDMVKFIRIGRLMWTGHVARMEPDEIPRTFIEDQIYGSRRIRDRGRKLAAS